MEDNLTKPNRIKKGDIIISNFGGKMRPCVTVKVIKGLVCLIPLTTTQDELTLIPCGGRFYEGSYFSKGVAFMKEDYAIKFFKGVYEHNPSLNLAIKELKEILNKI